MHRKLWIDAGAEILTVSPRPLNGVFPTLRRLRADTGDRNQGWRVSAEERRSLLRTAKLRIMERRKRDKAFGVPGHFGEPTWEMLLDLFVARLEDRLISVSSACFASSVPTTTALRYLKHLESEGLVVRKASPGDGRVTHVSLTDVGASRMARALA